MKTTFYTRNSLTSLPLHACTHPDFLYIYLSSCDRKKKSIFPNIILKDIYNKLTLKRNVSILRPIESIETSLSCSFLNFDRICTAKSDDFIDLLISMKTGADPNCQIITN